MNLEERVIGFLEDEKALQPTEQTSPSINDEYEVLRIDWRSLLNVETWDFVENDQFNEGLFADIIGSHRISRSSSRDIPDWVSGSSHPGFDIAAWYQQIHYYPDDWGIFIYEHAIIDAAKHILWRLNSTTHGPAHINPGIAKRLLFAAFATYFLHEQFHHRVESFAIRQHVATGSPSYIPYWKAVYQKVQNTDRCLEEALANANAFNRLSDQPYSRALGTGVRLATSLYIQQSIKLSPKGYRNGDRYLSRSTFENGLHRMLSQIQSRKLAMKGETKWGADPRVSQSLFPLHENIYTIVRKGSRSILPIHVAPAGLGTASSRDLEKFLLHCGAKIKAQSGSHRQFELSDGRKVTVPVNRKDLKPKTLKSILNSVGYHLRDWPQLKQGM